MFVCHDCNMQQTSNIPSCQFSQALPNPRGNPGLNIKFSQFLRYLELLKEGEVALRKQVEEDEEDECQRIKGQQHRNSLRTPDIRRPSSRLSTPKPCVSRPTSGVGLHSRKTSLRVSQDTSLCSSSVQACCKDTPDLNGILLRYVNTNDNEEELQEVEQDKSWRRISSPACLQDSLDMNEPNRRSSAISDNLLIVPRSRRVSFVPNVDRVVRSGHPTCRSRLPSITLNYSACSPRQSDSQNSNFRRNSSARTNSRGQADVIGSQGGSRRSSRASTGRRLSRYSLKEEGEVFSQISSNLVNQKYTVTSRNARQQTNKNNMVVKEVVLPCMKQCYSCILEKSPGPVKLCYSNSPPERKCLFMDGITDGNGRPGWPLARRNEIRGLIYNRHSHSLHPPMPRKWADWRRKNIH